MESSSEISFTWTDASSDSTASYKIVKEEQQIRRNNCNGSAMANDTKVKKNKQADSDSCSSVERKMVKVEPESDYDIPRKKQKVKHSTSNGNDNSLRESSYDESFLELKVKQEEITAASSSRKNKKKLNASESIDENDSDMENKNNIKETTPDSYNENLFDTEMKTKKKKKKSKRKRDKVSLEDANSNSQGGCEDTQSKGEDFSQNNNSISKMEETSIREKTFENDSCDEISAIQCDDQNFHTLSFNSIQNVESKNKGDSLYKSAITNQLKIDQTGQDEAIERKTPRISDRIRFEDEDEPETEFSPNNHNTGVKTSGKLKKFLKTANKTKLISQELHRSSTLTCDDEIWIVHCPKEIDVQGFCDADLNVHGKSKLKVGGQTYDGMLDNEQCDMTTVLTMEHGQYKIHNVPLCGIIQYRKRIPKAHYHDDNIMVNNQTNFIPLPETKCRHPLFGSHYKKALKIPAPIAQQLNSYNMSKETATTEKQKKKKHKRHTSVLKHEDSDSMGDVKLTLEPGHVVSEKKRKKRKYMSDEDPVPKKIKKLKHDPESAEAWESEKAIEQNLFSF